MSNEFVVRDMCCEHESQATNDENRTEIVRHLRGKQTPTNLRVMPHFITDRCIGCTICAKKCPVDCIAGENKAMHVIDPEICIDCGVCESYCPVEAISNDLGQIVPKVNQQKKRPIARVIEELCTGCEFCVAACPFDCLDMDWEHHEQDGAFYPIARMTAEKEKDCVGCRLCEEVCIKSAIVVSWPSGHEAPSFFPVTQTAESVTSS